MFVNFAVNNSSLTLWQDSKLLGKSLQFLLLRDWNHSEGLAGLLILHRWICFLRSMKSYAYVIMNCWIIMMHQFRCEFYALHLPVFMLLYWIKLQLQWLKVALCLLREEKYILTASGTIANHAVVFLIILISRVWLYHVHFVVVIVFMLVQTAIMIQERLTMNPFCVWNAIQNYNQ